MIEIARLVQDHIRIRAAGDALAAAVSVPSPIAPERLEHLRWELARLSLLHLPLDERYVQVPLENHQDANVRQTAARFRKHANAFSAAFRGHVAQWPAEKTARDWLRYGSGVRALVAQLHERLDMEETELYPLAESIGVAEAGPLKRNWASDAWTLRASIFGSDTSST